MLRGILPKLAFSCPCTGVTCWLCPWRMIRQLPYCAPGLPYKCSSLLLLTTKYLKPSLFFLTDCVFPGPLSAPWPPPVAIVFCCWVHLWNATSYTTHLLSSVLDTAAYWLAVPPPLPPVPPCKYSGVLDFHYMFFCLKTFGGRGICIHVCRCPRGLKVPDPSSAGAWSDYEPLAMGAGSQSGVLWKSNMCS